ncbi:MAG: SLC13 family permease [Thiotrichaceae bacterium]|nr:SLC13 family permease [Thiotrichaceae bacterium]
MITTLKNTLFSKHTLGAAFFLIMAIYLASLVPTAGIAWAFAILLLTVYLFAFEVVSVDVAAIVIMVLLGLSSLFAPYIGLEHGLVPSDHLFDGFSSNAVVSIMAVMIIGAGLDKTGIMSKVAAFILKVGGTKEKGIIPVVSGTVAIISSFMQNVGAAALFLPVVGRISKRASIPMSRLLMPMGFCAILGGTVTMIGSSPLILLNDLILTSNKHIPPESQMETWGLFSVTPIGLALVTVGVLYFIIAGRFVLPAIEENEKETDSLEYFRNTYDIDLSLQEIHIDKNTQLTNQKIRAVEQQYNIRVIALKQGGSTQAGIQGIDRNIVLHSGQKLGVVALASKEVANELPLKINKGTASFVDVMSHKHSGMAEILISSTSSLIGKSACDIWLRKQYGLSLMGILRNGKTIYAEESEQGIRDIPFQAGDMLLVYTTWVALERISGNRDFVVITTEYPRSEDVRPDKLGWAMLFFSIALGLVLFTELKLSVALLTGAIGMVLAGVLRIEEAYAAISWKTVFLLASLIPLGYAVESTGTAKWIADHVLQVVGDFPIWGIQLAVAILATIFTLVMSNVGATVLLVPLAVNIAIGAGGNPATFALIVALATSNSFLIPTHQVNALIMGPGGYRVPDFMKAGSVMTLLFLFVLILMMNLVY